MVSSLNDSFEELENTFKILVTSDNHVGYLEKDGVRGTDSFKTFEEILFLAKTHNVDFILLAGDLFHDNRPSMQSTNEVIRLLRMYCLDDRPVCFETISDPTKTFANTSFERVNYSDPNFNIGIPIFAIHGNHDDPTGNGNVCALDLLHSGGLLNLFGKSMSVENLDVWPILLRKGTTKLAMYGIGAAREERLHRLFVNNNVAFLRPELESDDWFSILAVHQNRVRHGPTNYLPEQFLPDFLELVVWGHEHDCRIEPEWNSSQNFYVMQPGSSVATSLSDGESLPKAVALLEVRGKEFKVTRLPLKTVRPFIFSDIVLEDEPSLDATARDAAERVQRFCIDHVTKSITATVDSTSKALSENRNSSQVNGNVDISCRPKLVPPPEPLIRLRVDLSGGFESFSTLRFGQKFVGRAANPKDLISFNRKKEKSAAALLARTTGSTGDSDPSQIASGTARSIGLSVANVETIVCQLLTGAANCRLHVFTPAELATGLRYFVDQDNKDGIKTVVDNIVEKTKGHLITKNCPEERIPAEIDRFLTARNKRANEKGESITSSGTSQSVLDIDSENFGFEEVKRIEKRPENSTKASFAMSSSVTKSAQFIRNPESKLLPLPTLSIFDDDSEDDCTIDPASQVVLSGLIEDDDDELTITKSTTSGWSNRWPGQKLDNTQSVSRALINQRGTKRGRPRTRASSTRGRQSAKPSMLKPSESNSSESDGDLSFDFRRKRMKR